MCQIPIWKQAQVIWSFDIWGETWMRRMLEAFLCTRGPQKPLLQGTTQEAILRNCSQKKAAVAVPEKKTKTLTTLQRFLSPLALQVILCLSGKQTRFLLIHSPLCLLLPLSQTMFPLILCLPAVSISSCQSNTPSKYLCANNLPLILGLFLRPRCLEGEDHRSMTKELHFLS